MSQSKRLLECFKKGNKINRLSALLDLGIFELSARVIDLENKGYKIERKRMNVFNRWNEKICVMDYWLEAKS